jgi:tetratricopeptide (TPR) repeat protein
MNLSLPLVSTLRSGFGRTALAAGLVAVMALPAAAQVGRSGLMGVTVDEAGQPMADIEITLQPVGETAGRVQVLKSDRRGRFANRVLTSGRYVIDVGDKDRFYIKAASVEVKDSGGILLTQYDLATHPIQGLPPIPIQGGQVSEVRLVITDAAYRQRLVRQIEGGAIAGEAGELVRLFNAGQLEEALALGKQLMEATTTEIPEVMHVVGMTYGRMGRYSEGEAILRRVIELQPDQAEYAASLGTMLLEKARGLQREEKDSKPVYAEAEIWLGRAVNAMNPPPVPLLTNYSIALEGAGRSDVALQVMERIATLQPENVIVRLRMAALLRSQGEPERALELLNSLPGGSDPRAVDGLYNIGLTFYNDQDYESAMVALNRAAEIDANHAQVQRLLGRLHYQAGDYPTALKYLNRFLELDPNHVEAPMEREMVKYLAESIRRRR